jgi:lysozyme
MKLSQQGANFIKRYESCKLTSYKDGGGVWTIGWGHTGPEVKAGLKWTQDRADSIFTSDIAFFENCVNNAVEVPLTQNQFDALLSICYNVGPGRGQGVGGSDGKDGIIVLANGESSTLLRKLNAGDYPGASREFIRWNRIHGTVSAGLTKRRFEEAAVFVRKD